MAWCLGFLSVLRNTKVEKSLISMTWKYFLFPFVVKNKFFTPMFKSPR